MQRLYAMMWMILQTEKPEDWVIATGKTTSMIKRDIVKEAFECWE